MRAKVILLAAFLLTIILAGGGALYFIGPQKAISKPVPSGFLFTPHPTDEYSEIAKTLIEGVQAKDYKKTSALYDEEMRKALPPEKENAFWGALSSQYGNFRRITGYARTDEFPYYFVLLKSEYEKASITFRIVFNSEKKIVGFFVQEVV